MFTFKGEPVFLNEDMELFAMGTHQYNMNYLLLTDEIVIPWFGIIHKNYPDIFIDIEQQIQDIQWLNQGFLRDLYSKELEYLKNWAQTVLGRVEELNDSINLVQQNIDRALITDQGSFRSFGPVQRPAL